ncbi:hypothetical protein [Moorena sp. SIO3A2]|uniref:hypothetical protein n=1 Tax=Moorena sp. SIO3A2 TaxID=2607841 RepID=UPI0013BC9963|nr:hypothetical protein [Moorena sp. SIO3A2]NER90379.1 hypothetical protein [Moorena sp. SIO3A2]
MVSVLRQQIFQVTIADTLTFTSGDGLLIRCSASISEQDRASQCSVEFFDYNSRIANLLMLQFQDQGGILTPTGLLEELKKPNTPTVGTNAPAADLQGDDLAKAIIRECLNQGITQREQIAYVLATAEHESGMGKYKEELASGTAYEGRRDLGNTLPGDGPRYKGRGPGMLTGRINYGNWGDKLGIDLLEKPELASEPKYALVILTKGMKEGSFTGRSLSNYIRPGLVDYVGARRIINGTDRAEAIATLARNWAIRLSNGEFALPSPTTKRSAAEIFGKVSASATDPSIALPKLDGQGIKFRVSIGFTDTSLTTFDYFLTGLKSDHHNVTRLTGKQLRFILGQEERSSQVIHNTSLRQLAKRIKGNSNIQVTVPKTANRIEQLIQLNQNNYQSLVKLAQRSGFLVRGSIDSIKIEPITIGANTFEISKSQLLNNSYWGDNATTNRLIKGQLNTNSSAKSNSEILDDLNEDIQDIQAGIQKIDSVIDEGKGIGKGFNGQLLVDSFRLPGILKIKPGDLIRLSDEFIFSMRRKYRVSEVSHTLGITTIDIYLPVAVKAARKTVPITSGESGVTKTFTELPPTWRTPLKKGERIAGYPVTSPFGLRTHPVTGRRRLHGGVDVGAPKGTPLYVIGDKITLKRFFDRAGGGNVARFSWGVWTFDFLHCHLVAPEGEYEAGAQIAVVGNTGVGTGAHLHFTQRLTEEFTEKVDPFRGYVYWALKGVPPK